MSEWHVVRAERTGSLEARLTLLRQLVSDGHDVRFEVGPADVPVAAVVTAAMEAGATRVAVVGDHPDRFGIDRDVRRASDVATALVLERGGALR